MYGKMPGDWYGINSVANVMEILNSYYKPDRSLEIVVFSDLGISPSRCIKIAGINCTCQNFRKESIDEEDEGFVNLHRKTYSPINKFYSSGKLQNKQCECKIFNKSTFHNNDYKYDLIDDFDDDDSSPTFFDLNLKRTQSNNEQHFNPKWVKKLFIIVCVRFGYDLVNKSNFEYIKNILKMKHCVGAIGGRK